jgi:hypothetical protein
LARARQRYVITGTYNFNGFSLVGQRVVRLSECNWCGRPSKYKRELTHWNVRFEDKKWLKTTSIPVDTIQLDKKSEGSLYVRVEDLQD